MIRINLLPHREEKRKARRQQFYVLTALVAVLAGLIVFLGYSIISGYITTQDERNDFLKKEIAVLDKQLEEMKRLKEHAAALAELSPAEFESYQRLLQSSAPTSAPPDSFHNSFKELIAQLELQKTLFANLLDVNRAITSRLSLPETLQN